MAIYHLHAKVVKRSEGRTSVGAAAYRSGTGLTDERTGHHFDYTKKPGIEHSEIIAPEGAPDWVYDRAALWNTVERAERRRDAQTARDIEIALPVELSKDRQIELMRDYLRRTFVSKGMVADFAIHRDNPENPHAHVLLTTRVLTESGFGYKEREWNARSELLAWRSQWAEMANEHLARAGLDLGIDHRTLEAQRIALVPGRKIGLSLARQQEARLPVSLSERVAESRAIARENGERILADPAIVLKALTHQQATFTERDIAKYLHTRTEGAEQFQAAFLKVTTHDELVALGPDEQGAMRYTTREMLRLERQLLERGARMAADRKHGVSRPHRAQVLVEDRLSAEQREAFEHVTSGADLTLVIGVAGAGKSTMLGAARRAWEAEGLTVTGAALSGIAAQNLEHASGIASRTLASLERAWEGGHDALTSRHVLVIDEAGLVGTRQMARLLERAESARAKVVLVGDPEQLQAIEAGAPFRGLSAQTGVAELTEVRRQRIDWQQEATRRLAHGRTVEALTTYEGAQHVAALPTREAAREALLIAWQRAGEEHPNESRLMLAYTRDDVQALNTGARVLRERAGELGRGELIETERGPREFAPGDRLYFLRNERSLGVRNGSLGTIERVRDGMLQVRLDGDAERRVAVDTRFYTDLDHGYAATVYKAQGATVDRTLVLATSHFDRHSTYVALSRHREGAQMFYGREDFRGDFKLTLARARPKALAHDYLERSLPDGAPSDAERSTEAAPASAHAATPAERFRQRVDEAALRFAHQRAAEQPAREARQRRRALEQYRALERQREMVRERQRELQRGLHLER